MFSSKFPLVYLSCTQFKIYCKPSPLYYQFGTKFKENKIQLHTGSNHKLKIPTDHYIWSINSNYTTQRVNSPFVKSFSSPNEFHCVSQQNTESLILQRLRSLNPCPYPRSVAGSRRSKLSNVISPLGGSPSRFLSFGCATQNVPHDKKNLASCLSHISEFSTNSL